MPSINENYQVWTTHDWSNSGHEWSGAWGSTAAMWWGTIFPRIQKYVKNCSTILEIAPGFGRCTEYLKEYPKELILVDLSDKCIRACKDKFKHVSNIQYFVNDGTSLDMVSNDKVDFIFSWDSLVHVEEDVLKAYISQFAGKLTKDGVAFIHHSNFQMVKGEVENVHWRGESVSAKLVKKYCEDVGLCCVSQELINWDGVGLIDCITVITPKGSIHEKQYELYENKDFITEANNIKKYFHIYDVDSVDKKVTVIDYSWLKDIKKSLYLWGTGALAERNIELLRSENIGIAGFIDSDPKKQISPYLGHSVHNIDSLKKEDIFIIISSSYFKEIKVELENQGYVENKDFITYL